MPRVFTNYFTFSEGAVPNSAALNAALGASFNQTFELEEHERGFHGAMRQFASLKNDGVPLQIWIYWEPERPMLEIIVDEPMLRMLRVNAALATLNGKPRYPDGSWKAAHRGRVLGRLSRMFLVALLMALALAIIYFLHWWGVLIVVGTTAIAAVVFTIGLARAFSNHR